jgi:hypothetical protein
VTEFHADLANLKRHLLIINEAITTYTRLLRDNARDQILARRNHVLAIRGLVPFLGYPLRVRPDAPSTYVVPIARRRLAAALESSSAPFAPESALAADAYDHILSVMSNMVAVMERSPRAFKDLKEEDIRTHFLVQLNGHYDGQATGETFNFDGKTDILIRVDGKVIFIAECKFWNGERALTETIDQILGYLSWRDTKAAIALFNRRKNFSATLSQIPGIVRKHANYRRDVPFASETASRYVLHHRDDPNRELILTVLAFEVPA